MLSSGRYALSGMLLAVFLQVSASLQAAEIPDIVTMNVPENGIQPRLVQTPNGDIHLLYFRKRMADYRNREGDLYYRSFIADSESWSAPVRVSSASYSHLDAIGRASMAIDASGRLHVVWYRDRPEPAYFYTRSDEARTRFEPAREIVQENLEGVDAGADVAASGNQVVITWGAGDLMREDQRQVYARISEDSGATFGPETAVSDRQLGACACCALAVEFMETSHLLLSYRSAVQNSGRHMQVADLDIAATNPALDYKNLHPMQRWELSACPVTTNDFVHTGESAENGLWLVYEMQNRVLAQLLPEQVPAGELPPAPFQLAEPLTQTRQKHPSASINNAGQMLVVWAEGIGYTRGGALNLSLRDAEGEALAVTVPEINIADFSFPAAASLQDNRFLVLY